MSNRKPFIDPSMFTKPPPNFNKTRSLQRDQFKVPNLPLRKKPPFNKARLQDYPTNSQNSMAYRNYSHSTQSSTTSRNIRSSPHVKFNLNLDRRMYSASSDSISRNYLSPQTKPDSLLRNYKNTPPPNSAAPPPNVLKNFKNEPPPNYLRQKPSVYSSLERRKDIVFNPVSLIQPQPFKLNVPPPQINNSVQQNHHYRVPMKPSPNNVQNNVYNRPKEVYWCRAPDYSHSLAQFSPSSILSSQLNLPPPQHHPPLPPGAPPRNPPPPPSGSPPSVITFNATSQGMTYLHNNMQIHSGSYNNHQLEHQHQHQGNNFITKEASSSYNHYNLKRKYETSPNDFQKKIAKKKKKPLSQMVQRINWSLEEAKKALEVELSCNTTARRQSLIIKFPDLELNRDIVTNFHSSIQHVHFQQPSTARYCFVTIADSADPETVISQLNRIPFGLGYLTAEFKKERDDDHNLKSTDIDPLTLYVGNLAQEVTKDDMTRTFPKQKRIDIGYAKKMKYTRYAFVSFYTVDDAIEAFKKTHSSQMYSKSLIVRFRRLHGTVGMPGEPKPVTPRVPVEMDFNGTSDEPEIERENNPWDIDVSHWGDYSLSDPIPEEEDEEESWKMKPYVKLQTRLRTDLLENEFLHHRPQFMKIKQMDYEISEDTDYQSLYDQRESDDEFSCSAIEFSCSEPEFSCPDTPQTPEMEPNAEHDVIDDETSDSQEFKDVLVNIKQEGIKQESTYLNSTRFRVISETVRPNSSLVVNLDDNNIPDDIKAKEEDYNISPLWKENSTNDSQIKHNEQCSPVYSESSNFTNSSNVQLSNTQKQIMSATSEDINQSIVPVPIIIKTEDEKKVSDPVHGQLSGNSSSNNQSDVQKNSSEQVLSKDGCDIQISAGNGSINLVDRQNQSGANDDSQTENLDKEKDAQYQYEGENFSWMNVDYSTQEIKAEADYGDEYDDDSSEDELSLDNIRKKARGSSTVRANIQ